MYSQQAKKFLTVPTLSCRNMENKCQTLNAFFYSCERLIKFKYSTVSQTHVATNLSKTHPCKFAGTGNISSSSVTIFKCDYSRSISFVWIGIPFLHAQFVYLYYLSSANEVYFNFIEKSRWTTSGLFSWSYKLWTDSNPITDNKDYSLLDFLPQISP